MSFWVIVPSKSQAMSSFSTGPEGTRAGLRAPASAAHQDRRRAAAPSPIGQGTPDEGAAADVARTVGRLLAQAGATVVTGASAA